MLVDRIKVLGMAVFAVALLGPAAAPARCCPFCTTVSQTFSEEMESMSVAAIVRLTKAPSKVEPNSFDNVLAEFKIDKVVKGEEHLGDEKVIRALYFGEAPVGSRFLITGIEPPELTWSTPIPVSKRGEEYLGKLLDLPRTGAERLEFFLAYLEDLDEMLNRDAYDEFAKAPYADVKELRQSLPHDQLIKWINDPAVILSHRRLYLTLLGVCGSKKDADYLETLMKSNDRHARSGLDAIVAAYLTLKGPDGLELVNDLFLRNKPKNAEYTDTYAAIMALRFHGQEEQAIPREKLLASLRLMLDRKDLEDLVIPDLARWEDWSVMDRLVQMFKDADKESGWVRLPIVNYFRACPLPEAAEHLKELAKISPETMQQASLYSIPRSGGDANKQKSTGEEKSDADEAKGSKPKGEREASLTPTEKLQEEDELESEVAATATITTPPADPATTDAALTPAAAEDATATPAAPGVVPPKVGPPLTAPASIAPADKPAAAPAPADEESPRRRSPRRRAVVESAKNSDGETADSLSPIAAATYVGLGGLALAGVMNLVLRTGQNVG